MERTLGLFFKGDTKQLSSAFQAGQADTARLQANIDHLTAALTANTKGVSFLSQRWQEYQGAVQGAEAATEGAAKQSGVLGGALDRLKGLAGGIGTVMAGGLIAGGAAAVVAGKGLLGVADAWDSVRDSIQVATGASGKALDSLYDSAKRVFSSGPFQEDAAAEAVALLNQRLDLTGPALEGVATRALNLSRITNSDLNANLSASADLFSSWNVAAEQQSTTMDKVFRAAQRAGIPYEKLAKVVADNGPTLRAMNMGLDESIALLASFEKRGLDATQVVASFNKFAVKDAGGGGGADVGAAQEKAASAADRAAKAQERYNAAVAKHGAESDQARAAAQKLADAQAKAAAASAGVGRAQASAAHAAAEAQKGLGQKLQDVFERIKRAKGDTDAGRIAIDAFGKSGLAMADMIRSGKMSYEELLAVVQGGAGINDAASATDDWSQKLATLKNRFKAALEPMAGLALDAANGLADAFAPAASEAIDAVGRFAQGIKDGEGPISAFTAALRGIGGDETPPWIVALAEGLDGLQPAFDATAKVARSLYEAFMGFGDTDFSKLLDGTPFEGLAGLFEGAELAARALGDRVRDQLAAFGDLIDVFRALADGNPVEAFDELTDALAHLLGFDVTGVFDAWDLAFADVVDGARPLLDSIKQIYDDVVKFFSPTKDEVDELRSKFDDAWKGITGIVSRAIDWFRKNIVPVIMPILGEIGRGLAGLVRQFTEHWGNITSVVGRVMDWFNAHVRPTLVSIWDEIGPKLAEVVQFFQSHLGNLRGIVSGAFDVVSGLVRAAFYTIRGIVETALALVRGDWDGAWEAVKGAAKKVGPALGDALSGLGEVVVNAGKIALDAAISIGSDIVSGIRDGLSRRWDSLKGFITDQASKLPEWVKKILGISSPSKRFAEVGKFIVDGLRVGIERNWSRVLDLLEGSADDLVARMRDALGIHSPSKAFQTVGEAIGAGLERGLASLPGALGAVDDTIAQLQGAQKRMADAMAPKGDAKPLAARAGRQAPAAGDAGLPGGDAVARAADLLRGAFSGVEAAVDLLTARIADLNKRLGDLAPSLSGIAAPADEAKGSLLDTAASFGTIVSAIGPMKDLGFVATLATSLAGAMTLLTGASGAAAGAGGLGAVGAALGSLALPIAAVVAGAALLYMAWESNFGGIRDKTQEIAALVTRRFEELKQSLSRVFGDVWKDTADLRAKWSKAWEDIQAAAGRLVSWLGDNLGAGINKAFDLAIRAVEWFRTFWASNGDSIVQIVTGWWTTLSGLFSAGFSVLKGLWQAGLALLRGDWAGVRDALVGAVGGWWDGVKQAFGGLVDVLLGGVQLAKDTILAPFIRVGEDIVAGVRTGVMNAWAGMKQWLADRFADLPAVAKAILGIHSPSVIFQALGEQVVEGMRQGLLGMADLAALINETLGKVIGDADRENFRSIAELTDSLLSIFVNTTRAIKALLDFDVVTTKEQISQQFSSLVGVFQEAILRMKELSQFANKMKPNDKSGLLDLNQYINLGDVINIDQFSKAMSATIDMIDGLLGIVERLEGLKLPSQDRIRELLPLLASLGTVAADFIHSVGRPEGEDATAYFANGASTAAAIAEWVKAVADIVGLKIDSVMTDFADRVKKGAAAADLALQAISEHAEMSPKLLTVIQNYTSAAGAAVDLLRATADLDLSKMKPPSLDQLLLARNTAKNAMGIVEGLSKDYEGVSEAARLALRDWVDAASAAMDLLGGAADLDLSKVVAVDVGKLAIAGRNAQVAESLVRALATVYVNMGADAHDIWVPAVKDYVDAAGGALDLLAQAGSLALGKASAVDEKALETLADNAEAARVQLHRVAQHYVDLGKDGREVWVPAIKDYIDAAGGALDLLSKASEALSLSAKGGITDELRAAWVTLADAAEGMLLQVERVSRRYETMGAELRDKLTAAIEGYVDAAGGAVDLLAAAGSAVLTATPITDDMRAAWSILADSAEGMLLQVERVADRYSTMEAELRDKLTAGIKGYTDAAQSAFGLLTGSLDAIERLSAVKRLGSVQPRLIDAILGQAAYVIRTVARHADDIDPETVAKIGRLSELTGSAFDLLTKGLAGIEPLSQVKRLGSVQPRLIHAILGQIRGVVETIARTTLPDIDLAPIKRWNELADVAFSGLTSAAEGIAKLAETPLSGKHIDIDGIMAGVRVLFDALGQIMTGPGGITAEVASARAVVAGAAGQIAEGLSGVIDLMVATVESPFGRIKSRGALGRAHRADLALRVKESLVASVQAAVDALGQINIVIPDGVESALKRLVDAWTPFLELLERLRDLKVDLRKLRELAKAPGILAGGLPGGSGGGEGGSGSVGGGGAPGGPGAGGQTINNFNFWGQLNIVADEETFAGIITGFVTP